MGYKDDNLYLLFRRGVLFNSDNARRRGNTKLFRKKGKKKMTNYNIVASTEEIKYKILDVIRAAGAVLTGVSGYGSGYYIQLDATQEQADQINSALQEVSA